MPAFSSSGLPGFLHRRQIALPGCVVRLLGVLQSAAAAMNDCSNSEPHGRMSPISSVAGWCVAVEKATRYGRRKGDVHGNQKQCRPSSGRSVRTSRRHRHVRTEPAKRISLGRAACRDKAGGVSAGECGRGNGGWLCTDFRAGWVVTAQNGPAATLLVAPLAESLKASIPILALVQEVTRATTDKNAFQELDHQNMFAPVSKVGPPDRPRRPAGRPCRNGFHRGGVWSTRPSGDPGARRSAY